MGEVEFQKPDFRLPKTRKAEARKAKSAKDKKDAEAEKLRLFNLPLKKDDVAVAQALLPISNPDEKHKNIKGGQGVYITEASKSMFGSLTYDVRTAEGYDAKGVTADKLKRATEPEKLAFKKASGQ